MNSEEKIDEAERLTSENARLLTQGQPLIDAGKWQEFEVLIQQIKHNRLTAARLQEEVRIELAELALENAKLANENAKDLQHLERLHQEILAIKQNTAVTMRETEQLRAEGLLQYRLPPEKPS